MMDEHAEFDENFENRRIQMLLDQHPESQKVNGKIRFLVDDDGRLGKATWTFDDDQQDRLRGSEFKWQVMELIDGLIIYRLQHGFCNNSALLTLDQGQWTLAWQ